MKKTEKVSLPKNKILILLVIILTLTIGLLSICIVWDHHRLNAPNDDAPFIKSSVKTEPIEQEIEAEEPKIQPQKTSRIVRKEDGTVEIISVEENTFVEQEKTEPVDSLENLENQGSEEYYYDTEQIVQNEDIEKAASTAQALVAATTSDPDGVLPDGFLPNPGSAGNLIFVFDDAGHNLQQLKLFLELPFPITVAVLPGLDYSVESANAIRQAGKEVILHQPMQAQNLSIDPGPRAILPEMNAQEVRSLVHQNLTDIGPVMGLNNHEGSLITCDNELLGAVLDVCKAEEIYFLDSRTTPDSVARTESNKRNMEIFERSVFLDNTQNKEDMITAVRLGMELASKNGSAIMIGHVWSSSLPEILVELYPEMLMLGYSVTTISQM